MQCRVNDVTVNDTPKFLVSDPTDQTHALTLRDPVHPEQTLTIPLELRGVISLLNVRTVTADMFNDEQIPHYDLTSPTLTWDPTSDDYGAQERAMTNLYGDVETHANVRGPRQTYVINSISSSYTDTMDITHDDNFYAALSASIAILSVDLGSDRQCVRLQSQTDLDQNDPAWRLPQLDPWTEHDRP